MPARKSLLDKLGVTSGAVLSILGVGDAAFRRRVRQRAAQVVERRPRKDSDLILVSAEAKADLTRLRHLAGCIKKTGAIWVVYPKGQSRITQTDVMAAAKRVGLVDVKVMRFSATHTALKLVIPLARR